VGWWWDAACPSSTAVQLVAVIWNRGVTGSL
jgi:hypothetical protein